MAEVYKVKTVGIAGFEKVQALKRILPALARQPRFIRSFVDEARIAVQLNHRNIVQVFDFGKVSGELFLSMELIDGMDLRTALADAKARGMRLSVPLACYIASEVGQGLDYAHNKVDSHGESLGIVHCDVSPQNVMLSYEGYVKILDFGVARARIGTQEWSRRLRGKPRYMAPEQTRGDPPTTATDVFALGIVTWEMLTGLPLFEGSDLKSLLQAVRRADAPPVDRLNPDVPPQVAAAVAKALSLAPEDRGTAAELSTCLAHTAQLAMNQGNARALAQWLAEIYAKQEPGSPDRQPTATRSAQATATMAATSPGGRPPSAAPAPTRPLKLAHVISRTANQTVTVRQPEPTAPAAPIAPIAPPAARPPEPARGDRTTLRTMVLPEDNSPDPDLSLERRVTTPWVAVTPEGEDEPTGITQTADVAFFQASQRQEAPSDGDKTQTTHTPAPSADDPRDELAESAGLLNPNTATVLIERDQRMENIDEESDPAAPAAALTEKRRVVAVAVLVDRGTREARQQLTQLLGDLAYKHGAVLHAEDEDSLVALFGLEIAGEDDVAKAMGYALDAVETTRETNVGAHTAGNEVLAMRIAARTGIVAVPADRGGHDRGGSDRGGSDRGGYRLVGDAVEETRALARSAEPSRPLLAGATGRLTSAYYAFREVPARRHQRRRVRVLELLGPRSFDERDRTLLSRTGRFIGRYRELALLSQALDRAQQQKERMTIAVVGPAGVGKSRLLAEFVARAEAAQRDERAPMIIAVAAMPGAKTAPFALLIDLLQAALGLPPERGEAARGRLSRRVKHVLTRTTKRGLNPVDIDEIVATLETAMELRDGVLLTGLHTSSDLRERVLGAWYAMQMATAQPDRATLTILEDVHLADATSVEVLRESLSAWSERPELIVLSAAPDTELARTLGQWVDQVVILNELGGADLEQLIEDRLADAATPERISTIAQRAGGNPLFVEQLATEARDVGEIPPTVRAVITARTDRLSAAAKAVLQHAAVMGPVVRAPILEELVDRDIAAELVELIDEQLLVREDGAAQAGQESTLYFAADLVREVVYDSLSATARRETHRTLGQLLAARHRAGRDEPPASIAEHLEKGGLAHQASAYWLRAGRLALAAGDAHSAVERFTRTVTIEDSRRADPPERAGGLSDAATNRLRGALEGREQANRQIGDHRAQQQDLERLQELARSAPEMLADVHNRYAICHLRTGDFLAAVRATEDAEVAARSCLDELAMGEALRIRGEVFERMGEFAHAMDMTQKARAIFQRQGALYEETTAMIGIGRNHLFAARYEDALVQYKAVIERVRESGDPWLERVVQNHVAVVHLCLGRYDEAMRSAKRAVEISRRYGDYAREGDSLSVCGIIMYEVGLLQKAHAYFTRALSILERTQSRWSRADCLVYAGAALCAMGDERGFELLDEAESLAREIGAKYVHANALAALARAALDRAGRGDIALAQRTTEAAVEVAREAKLISPLILALSRRAEAYLLAKKLDSAHELSERAVMLLERQRHIEGPEQEVLYTGYRIAHARGDHRAAAVLDRAYAEVMRKLESMGADEWRAAFSQVVRINAAILETARARG